MEVSSYVARRLMVDVFDADNINLVDQQYESIYKELCKWAVEFTTSYGSNIIPRIGRVSSTSEELQNEIHAIYAEILLAVDNVQSVATIHALFVITLYMLIVYKDYGPLMCSQISLAFNSTTQNLRGWNLYLYMYR
jgi:hypothetical protein